MFLRHLSRCRTTDTGMSLCFGGHRNFFWPWQFARSSLIRFPGTLWILCVSSLDPHTYRYLRPFVASFGERNRNHPTPPVVEDLGSFFLFFLFERRIRSGSQGVSMSEQTEKRRVGILFVWISYTWTRP